VQNLGAGFRHSALFYDDPAGYAAVVVPFVCTALERDDFVAVAGPRPRLTQLRAALGPDAGRIHFLSTEEWYVRPVRTIGGWTQMLRAAAVSGRSSARLVDEVDFGGQPLSWVRYESALNAALAGFDARMLCPYDRGALPPDLLDTAWRTHPHVHDGTDRRSDRFTDPERLLAGLAEPEFPASGVPIVSEPVLHSVADLRATLRNRATEEGWLPPDRIEILVLALSEVATNGIRHGGGHRELRVWVNPGAVVCEVTDDGARPPGPLAGYLPPTPGKAGGMGLWLVSQICDALSVRTAGGTTRARFALLR